MKIKAEIESDHEYKDMEEFKKNNLLSIVKILEIDGKIVLGDCELCGEYICEGDDFDEWQDGIVTCRVCDYFPDDENGSIGIGE